MKKQRINFFAILPCLLSVLAAVTLPRFIIAGNFPFTDEGVYEYSAQIINASLSSGHGLPDTSGLTIYPLMVSWVFGLSVNPIIAVRLIDMVVATITGIFLYLVLKNESKNSLAAAFISFIFLFAFNHPIFINAGFRNSIAVAFLPLLWALKISQEISNDGKKWFAVGALTAIGVLLREPFVIFLILGAIAILISRGWKPFLRFAIGSAVVGCGITILICIFRGGIHGLFTYYFAEMTSVYGATKDMRFQLMVSSIISTINSNSDAIILGIIAFITAIYILRQEKTGIRNNSQMIYGRLLFWMATTLIPIVEPLSKSGHPYHFSVCFIGMAGLTAYCWKIFIHENRNPARKKYGLIALIVFTLISLPKYMPIINTWEISKINLSNWSDKNWDTRSVAGSNYLLIAEIIKKHATPDSTLSINSFMHVLYPLTGLLPSDYKLAHFSVTAIKHDFNQNKIKEELMACPPDFFVNSKVFANSPAYATIAAMLESTGIYEPIGFIQQDKTKSYGSISGTIYKKTDGAPKCKHW